MDETVRAVLAAKEQAAITRQNAMLKVAQAKTNDEVQLQELVAARAITKLAELKQAPLVDATILEVISVKGERVPRLSRWERKQQAEGHFLARDRLLPRGYKEVGPSRKIAAWLIFTIIDTNTESYSKGPLWEMYLDSEGRFRWQACGGNRPNAGYPPISLRGFEIAGMPGYIQGQTYDFSSDVRAIPLEYLTLIAIDWDVAIPLALEFPPQYLNHPYRGVLDVQLANSNFREQRDRHMERQGTKYLTFKEIQEKRNKSG